ncbi:hypothetical protein [Burkholderia sp. 22PA0106]|uniref:hypothetical protein n=1 Tax=Burkholderia sp. 22PA0106 TaxID=3237371 RepID=UPI0039C0A2D7
MMQLSSTSPPMAASTAGGAGLFPEARRHTMRRHSDLLMRSVDSCCVTALLPSAAFDCLHCVTTRFEPARFQEPGPANRRACR